FGTDTLLTKFLRGRDESPEDVAVLDETLAIGLAEGLCHTESRRDAGLRNGHYNIDVGQSGAKLLLDCLRKLESHVASALVDVDTIDDRVGTRKVDILEDVGCVALLGID